MTHSVSLQAVLDERDIERALMRFARAMDERDWTTMSEILAEDVRGDFGNGKLEGAGAVVEMIRGFMDNCGTTQHLLSNVLVDVSGNHAVSRAYVRDVHLNSADDPTIRFYTIGDYHDTWQRRADGSWCITERLKVNRGYVGTLDVFGG